MAARAEIRRGDVPHTVGVRAELVTLAECRAGGVVRVVNRDGLATLFPDDVEARNVGGAITDVDHVLERHGTQIVVHVVVHVRGQVEQTLVHSE